MICPESSTRLLLLILPSVQLNLHTVAAESVKKNWLQHKQLLLLQHFFLISQKTSVTCTIPWPLWSHRSAWTSREPARWPSLLTSCSRWCRLSFALSFSDWVFFKEENESDAAGGPTQSKISRGKNLLFFCSVPLDVVVVQHADTPWQHRAKRIPEAHPGECRCFCTSVGKLRHWTGPAGCRRGRRGACTPLEGP